MSTSASKASTGTGSLRVAVSPKLRHQLFCSARRQALHLGKRLLARGFQHWADRAALDAHFAVPASADFVRRISALATEPPSIDVHEVVEPAER